MRDSEEEMLIIARMLKMAMNEGLEVEVVITFANEIRSGQQDYSIAAASALYEWDI